MNVLVKRFKCAIFAKNNVRYLPKTKSTIAEELTAKINEKFTEEILLDIVKTYYNLEKVKIEKIAFFEGSKKGDSYFSSVVKFTVNATGTNKCGKVESIFLPIFTKTLHKNRRLRETFRAKDFFENEKTFYQKVWPEIKQFQDSKNLQKPFNSIPSILACYSDGTNDFIAMEDLSYKGFKNCVREKGFNYDHTLMIIKLFAKFHGLSLAFKDQNPEKFEKIASNLKETYYAEEFRSYYCEFQMKLFEIVCDAVEKELPEMYLKKVKKLFSNDFYGKLSELAVKRDEFAVVTQGDAWIPNFLIKHKGPSKEDIPSEVILIDFQMSRFSSLTQDLTYFMYCCTDQLLREEYWDTLIEAYHLTLSDTLKNLGSNPDLITLECLINNIKENGVFGIGMVTEALTLALLNEDDIIDINTIEGDEAIPLTSLWRLHPYQDHEKRLRLANTFKHAVDKGIIH